MKILSLDSPEHFHLDLLFFKINPFFNWRHFENFLTRRSHFCIYLQKRPNNSTEFLRVICWKASIYPSSHLLVETFHILGLERDFQANKLVKHATQWPNIWLLIIGLIFPYLRTGVVRGSCLGHCKSLFWYLRNIHVSKLCHIVFIQKDVCCLYLLVVTFISRWKICRSCSCLSPWTSPTKIRQIVASGSKVFVYWWLLIFSARSPLVANSITMLSAFLRVVPKGLAAFVNESCLVAHHVRVVYRGQYADLV